MRSPSILKRGRGGAGPGGLAKKGMLVMAAAVLTGATACGGTSSSTSSSGASSSANVTIGVGEMLTGASEYYGNAVLLGAQLATTEINKNGGILGHKVVLQTQDDASDNSQAVNIVRSFAQDSSIGMAMAPTYQPNFTAACAVANQFGLPIVGAQSAALTGKENPKGYCWVVTSNVDTQISGGLQLLHQKKGIDTIAVVHDQTNSYVSGFNPTIVSDAGKAGMKVTDNISVTSGQTDYGPQITQIMQSNPQAVVPDMVTADAARFMQQLRSDGYKGLFVDLISELTNTRIYSLSSGAADGLFAVSPQSVGEASFKTFVDEYTAAYGAPQDYTYAGFGYDSMMLIAKAMEAAHSTTNRTAINKALTNMKTFCGSVCYNNAGGGAFYTANLYYVTLSASGWQPANVG